MKKKKDKIFSFMQKISIAADAVLVLDIFLLIFAALTGNKDIFYIAEWIYLVAMIVVIVDYFSIILKEVVEFALNGIGIRLRNDDALFAKLNYIDSDIAGRTNDTKLRMINYYYSENGPIEREIVKGKKIDRLYAQKDFLEKRLSVPQNGIIKTMFDIFCSLIFPLVLNGYNQGNNMLLNKIVSSTIFLDILWGSVAVIVICSLIKFSMRGHFGSYHNYVITYEMELLNNKIVDLENSFTMDSMDEEIYEMQQLVIKYLRKKSKGFGKKNSIARKEWKNVADLCLVENIPEGCQLRCFNANKNLRFYYQPYNETTYNSYLNSEQFVFYRILSQNWQELEKYELKHYRKMFKHDGTAGYSI